MNSKLLFAGAAALVLAACGEAEEDVAVQDDIASEQVVEAQPAGADAAIANSPQEFVDMQAASDMYEIEAARLAQEMGTSQKVKAFAAMMERDHTSATENLKAIAGQAQGVTVSPEMTAKQQSDIEALRNAGENFDRIYAEQQVAAHQQALDRLRAYASNGQSQPLQGFASETSSVVEGHLEQARDLP